MQTFLTIREVLFFKKNLHKIIQKDITPTIFLNSQKLPKNNSTKPITSYFYANFYMILIDKFPNDAFPNPMSTPSFFRRLRTI